jgi:hypothetical protein
VNGIQNASRSARAVVGMAKNPVRKRAGENGRMIRKFDRPLKFTVSYS